jgi:hypothetical protein
MLTAKLRGYSVAELQALSHSTVEEMVTRIDEAEESKEAAQREYDHLAELEDIWQAEVKLLKEICQKAGNDLRDLLSAKFETELKHFDVQVIKGICDGIFEGLERVKKLEE